MVWDDRISSDTHYNLMCTYEIFLTTFRLIIFFILLSLGWCYHDKEANFADRYFDFGVDSATQKPRSGETRYVYISIFRK